MAGCKLWVAGFTVRYLLLLALALVGNSAVQAQLRIDNDLHPGILPLDTFVLGAVAGTGEGLRSNVFTPDAPTISYSLKPFDFTQTAPHLAFFCRLEINEKAGFVIPAKFRLGGHRYWQDELGRRE